MPPINRNRSPAVVADELTVSETRVFAFKRAIFGAWLLSLVIRRVVRRCLMLLTRRRSYQIVSSKDEPRLITDNP